MKQQFRGTGVALVTPFKNKAIDYDTLGQIIDFVIDGGVDYIVSLGTTGEAITLSSEECLEVLRFTVKHTQKRVPVVAGYFGSNYTERLVNKISTYDFEGIAAIMSSSPAYSKPTQEGIYRHYMAMAEVCPVPIIIYNVPGRTSSKISAETILRLAHSSEKFIGVKEASGDVEQAMQIMKNRPDNFLVISGDDPLTLPLISVGGDGAISVIANAYPQQFSSMIRAGLEGDWATAQQLNFDLLDVHPWLYIEGNPVGVKAAMEIRGLCSKEVRIPLVELSGDNYDHLKAAMAKVPERATVT
ncbi:MAG: 4-hydroxy-tetrahydrodipicolinate synthase [Saprospiraceae bacterium]|nr:4-hydroxy-tetrahydrodipicolinate synthase [Saprospiraceae bacterium]